MVATIDGSEYSFKGSGTYDFNNGIFSAVETSISSVGPACQGSDNTGSAETAIEIVGNELRQVLPSPNADCPQPGDNLISVLIKQ